ncbi:MAG: hypothetical protein K8S25_11085, partial [Alphaproteobacteria bacterium]|nr:hypothetical protein [Alphaproteobacteria bacterium]
RRSVADAPRRGPLLCPEIQVNVQRLAQSRASVPVSLFSCLSGGVQSRVISKKLTVSYIFCSLGAALAFFFAENSEIFQVKCGLSIGCIGLELAQTKLVESIMTSLAMGAGLMAIILGGGLILDRRRNNRNDH